MGTPKPVPSVQLRRRKPRGGPPPMIAFSDQRGAREDPEIRSLGHAGGRHRIEVMRERGVAVGECLLLAPEGDVVGVEGRNRRVVWNPVRRKQDGALATVRE